MRVGSPFSSLTRNPQLCDLSQTFALSGTQFSTFRMDRVRVGPDKMVKTFLKAMIFGPDFYTQPEKTYNYWLFVSLGPCVSNTPTM